MPTRTTLNPKVPPATPHSETDCSSPGDVQELLSLAARGLVAMYDQDKQLFCLRLRQTEQGIVREGLSPQYTIMTLLGLRELELGGMDSPLDTRSMHASFVRDTNWILGIGDLGLLIWLTAAFAPDRLPGIFSKFPCETALDHYPDARAALTMELAWYLAGLAHAAEAMPTLARTLEDAALKTYRQLANNQGEFGFFGHMSAKNSFAGRLRGRIGSFADQVYPVYAISKFAKAFQLEEPLGHALECARAVCRVQGEMGQWWWLYDSRSGRVSSRYPVYSVHQHGMAPMGLFAVEEAAGESFTPFVYKGLRWIYANNELAVDMRDGGQNLIWRCILPENGHRKYWEVASSLVRSQNQAAPALKVLHEQRPYEFGWLLYAFGRKAGSKPFLKEKS